MKQDKEMDLNLKKGLDLLSLFKKNKKTYEYKVELLLSLFKWRANEDHIEDVKLNFNQNKKTSHTASSNENQIEIFASDIINAHSLKDMLDLIDSVFHELNHHKIKQDNKKHINYKPPFYFNGVYDAITQICGYDANTSYSITLALYAINPNEKEVRVRTYNQIDSLINMLKEKIPKDKRLLKRLVKIHNQKNIHQVTENLKHCIEEYSIYEAEIKKKVENFLLSYSKNPEAASEHESMMFKYINEIFPCQQAYKNLYDFYLNNSDLENAEKVLANPMFTQKNDLNV